MPNARTGYQRVTGEIPIELHERIKQFNSTSTITFNVAKVIEKCIEREFNKVVELQKRLEKETFPEMPFLIKHYDPNDNEYYEARAGNEEAAEQLKQVLEHLGMKEVTIKDTRVEDKT